MEISDIFNANHNIRANKSNAIIGLCNARQQLKRWRQNRTQAINACCDTDSRRIPTSMRVHSILFCSHERQNFSSSDARKIAPFALNVLAKGKTFDKIQASEVQN
jgi:hypothetical protein